MRLATLLRRAVTLPPQTWVKNDLHDTVFFLRVTLAVFLGALYGVLGAQGLMIFLTFLGLNAAVGNMWLKWQGIDEADWEDPDKVSQSPLTFEGFAPSVSFFVLSWCIAFNMA